MKILKLLTVPVVLLLSLAVATPALAHGLAGATVNIKCDQQAGRICVTLEGDIEPGNAARFVFFQVFEHGSTTPLDVIEFSLPAFDSGPGANNHFKDTQCFKVLSSNATSFTVKIVKVTSDAAGSNPSDLTLHLSTGDVAFDQDHQPITPVGDTDRCVAPTPTPQTPTPTASAAVTTTLAGTGGFDFRYPLIGLTALVAGLALLLVSASRGRSSTK